MLTHNGLIRLHHLASLRARQTIAIFITALIAVAFGYIWHTNAQSVESPWTQPVNISLSGAASQPTIAVSPNGVFHILWWDSIDGAQYARTVNVTGTVWSKPIGAPAIFGARMESTNLGKTVVSLTAPRDIRLLSDAQSNVQALWLDTDNQLLNAQVQGASWSGSTVLADSAIVMDAATDPKGGLHLAYVRVLNTAGNPAGVYYRATSGGAAWSVPVLVYASAYLRTAKPDLAHVSVTSDGLGQIIVVWDDPEEGRSFFARSTNKGRTWSDPQPVSSSQVDRAAHVRVVTTSQGDMLMLWPGASAEGCALNQRRSTDSGQTWSIPELVLTDLTRCPGQLSFAAGGDGRLWLLGVPTGNTPGAGGGTGIMAAWDGRTWSKPTDVNVSFRNPDKGSNVSLSCLRIALGGNNVGVVGCDSSADLWAARNAVGLETLLPALTPIWNTLQVVSDSRSYAGLPSLATDQQGTIYALWSQSPVSEVGATLYASVFDNGRWSRGAPILGMPSNSAPVTTSGQPATNKFEQPSLSVDSHGKLHAVWSGGLDGEIQYSSAYARDATIAQAWADPIILPAPTGAGSWPEILADPRGDVLHVIFAVPFNESRGIYYVRSIDGGTTWQSQVTVFDAVAATWASADKPRIALDIYKNVLHAVWLRAQLPGGVGPRAVFYARSTDGGQSWSDPVKAAEGWVDWPQVAVPAAGQVYLAWNQSQSRDAAWAEVWGQYSNDSGQRWGEPARVTGFEQVYSPADLVSDGAGMLHLVGMGRRATGDSTLLYAQWDGQTWTKRETLSLSYVAVPGNRAVAVLTPQSKQLTVVLRGFVPEQDGSEQFAVMATGREIVANLARPAPTFTPLPTSTPDSTATPQPTATSKPQLISQQVATPAPGDLAPGQLPLIVGGVLAIAVVFGVVIGRAIAFARK